MIKKYENAKNSSIVGILLVIILLIGVGFWWKNSVDQQAKMKLKNSSNSQSSIEAKVESSFSISSSNSNSILAINNRTNYTDYSFTQSGWIPDWGSEVGLQSLKQNTKGLQSISPVWYEAKNDGTLADKTPKKSTEIISFTKVNNIELIPSIASFDHEILTPVLQDPAKLELHVNTIIDVVLKNNYDGIELDYESTKLSDKEQFFTMLEKLSTKLHAKNKKLYFAVLPKWDDELVYASLVETRQVQDWSRMAKFVDSMRIMTYDYTSSVSKNPGPIAPLDWMESVIKYALTKADKSKFSLGIPLYGYERWVEVNDKNLDQKFDDPKLNFVTDFRQESSKTPMRAYTFNTIQGILKSNQGQTEDYQGEKIFRYSKINSTTKILENRVLVYMDSNGVKARTDLAKKYGLGGVSFWRLGEDKGLIQVIAN